MASHRLKDKIQPHAWHTRNFSSVSTCQHPWPHSWWCCFQNLRFKEFSLLQNYPVFTSIQGTLILIAGLPRQPTVKESACQCRRYWRCRLGSIPGSGRFPGGGNDNPLQYSYLESPMDRGAWWATVHGVAKSGTWLNELSMLILITLY